ncbi:MAG: hypothetical protein GC162_19485 [Planctomycetes bacterium]|nr:hypothetical protein [Planctomycetota bacterium]
MNLHRVRRKVHRATWTTIALLSATSIASADTITTSGLKAWLKGDATIVTSGTDVTQWNDNSGNANNATAVSQFPSKVTNAINGLTAVAYTDPVDHLNLPTTGASALNIVNSDYEIFVVSRSSSTATQFMTGGGFSSGVGSYEMQLNGGLGARFLPSTTATTDGTHLDTFADLGVANQFTDGRAHVFNARVDANVGYLRVSGMENGDTVLNARSSYTNLLTLGVRGNGSLSFVGQMGEVLIYNRALSSTERREVERYLANKWNAPLNVASQTQGGVAFANELISGGTNPNHHIDHLNDAKYGNAFSWIGNNTGSATAFAGVKFDGPCDINSLAFGRAATGSNTDRSIGTYTFQYTLDNFSTASTASINAATWVSFLTITYDGTTVTPWLRHLYDFATLTNVRGVRVQLSTNTLAIDELEVYGFAVPEPTSGAMLIAICPLVLRRRPRA